MVFKIIFRYSPPQVCRKLKIQDIVKKYRRERSVSDFYVSLFFFYQWCELKYTWIYENRVSKNFVIFLNFPCLTACLLCCLLISCFFFFACFVVRDLCRSGCRQNCYLSPPSLPIFALATILCLTQMIVIWNQCALKAVCDKRRLQTCRPQASRPADFQTR